MVLGLGEGEIQIELQRVEFLPGDTITGRARLTLKSPKPARAFRVEFYGLQGRKSGQIVFVQAIRLSGQRTYRPGEQFDFSIRIPPNAMPPLPADFAGKLIDIFVQKPHTWVVSASLDAPMELDISKKVYVKVNRPPPAKI